MPEVIVVASIGNRDITYEDGEGEVRNPGIGRDASMLATELGLQHANLRAISNELLGCYRDGTIGSAKFEFPILRPGLERVLSEALRIDRLLMIVTDQPQEVRFRTGDTIHCGELLAELVAAVFPQQTIDVDPHFLVVRGDPQKPNVMYPLIRDKLSELLRTHGDAAFYALATGGTPAITDGLRHAAMNVFRQDSASGGACCSVIQVDPPTPPATAGTARVVDWEPYLEDVVRDGARTLVEKGDFVGALDVLRAFRRGRWPRGILDLLSHAAARVGLRVRGAKRHAGAARQSMAFGGPVDVALQGVEVTGAPGAQIARVNEVRFLVELALERQMYAEALVRIEQFRESARSVFSLGVLDDKKFTLLGHVCGPLPEATVRGCGLVLGGQTLERWLTTNRATFDHGARQWVMRNDRDKQSVYRFAKGAAVRPGAPRVDPRRTFAINIDNPMWDNLGAVRNQAIHTPTGVSKASITAVITLADLRNRLGETASALFGSFGVRATTYPYKALKEAIVNGLAP